MLDINKIHIEDYIVRKINYKEYEIGKITNEEKYPCEIVDRKDKFFMVFGEWIKNKSLLKSKNDCDKIFESSIDIDKGWRLLFNEWYDLKNIVRDIE